MSDSLAAAKMQLEKHKRSKAATTKPTKKVEVGRVLAVGSSVATVTINKSIIRKNQLHLAQLGSVLKIITNNSIVVAMVSSLEVAGVDDEGMHDGCIAKLNILGEIVTNATTKETRFYRGVRSFPVLSEAVYTMTPGDLELIFEAGNEPAITVGRLQQDNSIVARVRTNDLLSKHFAIIGSTGSGKSCTVALVLQAVLDENPDAHVVLFDPHNEYSKSFGDKALVIGQKELDLPIWLFDFEETAELLTSQIADQKREETEILSEVIVKAKQLYDRSVKMSGQVTTQIKIEDVEKDLHRAASHISLDSPVPYRMRDILRLLEYYMGRLENADNLAPYKRLKRRIEILMADPRYQFVFKNQAAARSIKDITGDIFRIPVQGKPICILDFSGIPSEALNVVVSVVSRLAFELAMWSKRSIPILLVCEEAHRYIPREASYGFHATRRSISRIAKEGRKYGVSLGIVSQRPSELEPSTLSQCSTVFSMRLTNERDQAFVRAAVPDGAKELLAFLPSLGTAETMVFGESVNLPMRVILNTLAEERRPHSSSAEFTKLWSSGDVSDAFMVDVFNNWRHRDLQIAEEPPAQVIPMAPAVKQKPTSIRKQHAVQNAIPQTNNPQNQAPSLTDVKKMLNAAFHKNI